ncbi:MAG: hypothetical protein H0Z24_02085 [Thermosipho sp. (in: Bacteria)]|nr:hypothetical protein [Thermosipho sp. (in: thermotogales)]
MQEAIITFIGIVTVFIVFSILYTIFWFFSFFSKKSTVKLPKKVPIREELISEEEEVAAVVAAIYSYLGENARIISIRRLNKRKYGNRDWEIWKKSGWRGVKRWKESSRLE